MMRGQVNTRSRNAYILPRHFGGKRRKFARLRDLPFKKGSTARTLLFLTSRGNASKNDGLCKRRSPVCLLCKTLV